MLSFILRSHMIILFFSLTFLGCGSDEMNDPMNGLRGGNGTTTRVTGGSTTTKTTATETTATPSGATTLSLSVSSARCEEAQLSWKGPNPEAPQYRIDRKKPNESNYSVLTSVSSASLSFTDLAAPAGTVAYRIRPAGNATADDPAVAGPAWVYKTIDVASCSGSISKSPFALENLQISVEPSSEACVDVKVTYTQASSSAISVSRRLSSSGSYGAVQVRALPSGSVVSSIPAGSTGFINHFTSKHLTKPVHYLLVPEGQGAQPATISITLPSTCP